MTGALSVGALNGVMIATGAMGVADPYAGYLIYDTLTDDNATDVADHTPEKAPDGSAWADIDGAAGMWTISSNAATCSGAGDMSVEIDSGAANVDIVLTSVIAGKYFAIIARGDGTVLDYVMAQLQTAENIVQVAYHDGAYHAIANAAYSPDTATDFEFKTDGTALELLVDGASKVDTTSTHNQTDTYIGLYGYTEDGTCTVDGLTVTAL